MRNLTISSLLLTSIALFLSGCGGGNSTDYQAQKFDNSVAGYWTAQDTSQTSYEFYVGTTDAPFTSTTNTGRTIVAGQATGSFYWNIDANGALQITKVSQQCQARPISSCPSAGQVTIVNYASNSGSGNNGNVGNWKVTDSTSGVANVFQAFTRQTVDMSRLPQGQSLFGHNGEFDIPLAAGNDGHSLTLQLSDFGGPVPLQAPVVSGNQSVVVFPAGPSTAIPVPTQFALQNGSQTTLPVLSWYDNVHLSASINSGYALQYEMHRQVQYPAGTDPTQVVVGNVEQTEFHESYIWPVNPISGTTLKASDKFYTMMPIDFNQDWVAYGAGNEITLTSATTGTIVHVDPHLGTYSESRDFTWVQKSDGTVVFSFPEFGDVTMNFVSSAVGGTKVLFGVPNPYTGQTNYLIHDFVMDAPPVVNASNLPGLYAIVDTDGSLVYETFHKDGTVTGTVGGHWFIDTNGDVVSYQCVDLSGNDIAAYNTCYTDLGNVSSLTMGHLRRIRFVQQNGNVFLSKYNSAFYGAMFDVINRDYATIAWTYEWIRLGDE